MSILFMVSHLMKIRGQRDRAGIGRACGAGIHSKDYVALCAIDDVSGTCAGWKQRHPAQQKNDHYYPAAQPLWRLPVYLACCQLESGLGEAGNEFDSGAAVRTAAIAKSF